MSKKEYNIKEIQYYQELEFLIDKKGIYIESYHVCIVQVKGFTQKENYISCQLEVVSEKEMSYNPFIDAEKGLEYSFKNKTKGLAFEIGLRLDAGSIYWHEDYYLQFSGNWGSSSRLYFFPRLVLAKMIYLFLSKEKVANQKALELFYLYADK